MGELAEVGMVGGVSRPGGAWSLRVVRGGGAGVAEVQRQLVEARRAAAGVDPSPWPARELAWASAGRSC